MSYKFDAKTWIDNFVAKVNRNDDLKGSILKMDAGETMVLTRELEHLMEQTFDFQDAPLKSRVLLPHKATAPVGARTITYKQFQKLGQAKRIESYSDDLPSVTAQAVSDTRKIFSFGCSFEISFADLRAAAMGQINIDATLAAAARRACDEAIEKWALWGDAGSSATSVTAIPGFLNLDDTVPGYLTAVTPTTGTWSAATAEQIIGDIVKLWYSLEDGTAGVHKPNTLLIPNSVWGYVSQSRTYTDMSVANWCLANLRGCQAVEPWEQLDLANSTGAGARVVAYEKNQNNAWVEVPMDFTMHPPQERNLSYVVNCEVRTAGLLTPYPKSIAYMDSI